MTQRASKSIHNNGDAILFQSATKVTKTCGSKFGGLLWAVAPSDSDTTEKNGNMGAQLQCLRCIKSAKIFFKIYFLYDFWPGAHKLVHSEPFLDYLYEVCLSAI